MYQFSESGGYPVQNSRVRQHEILERYILENEVACLEARCKYQSKMCAASDSTTEKSASIGIRSRLATSGSKIGSFTSAFTPR